MNYCEHENYKKVVLVATFSLFYATTDAQYPRSWMRFCGLVSAHCKNRLSTVVASAIVGGATVALSDVCDALLINFSHLSDLSPGRWKQLFEMSLWMVLTKN